MAKTIAESLEQNRAWCAAEHKRVMERMVEHCGQFVRAMRSLDQRDRGRPRVHSAQAVHTCGGTLHFPESNLIDPGGLSKHDISRYCGND